MPPKLEQVFTLRAFLGKDNTLNLGSTKGGNHRIAVPVTGGFIEGPGIKMDILPGGGDWLRLDTSTNTAHLDIRFQARDKATGACLYGYYPGIARMDPAMQACLSWSSEAKTTESKDHYFSTTPIFEVSHEEHKWMEQTVFLSHGHWHVPGDGTQAVEYEVYKIIST